MGLKCHVDKMVDFEMTKVYNERNDNKNLWWNHNYDTTIRQGLLAEQFFYGYNDYQVFNVVVFNYLVSNVVVWKVEEYVETLIE